jgi:hypothetical protein
MAIQATMAIVGWPIGRLLSLALALLLIVGAGALSYQSQRGLVSADRAADHSREVLYETERLLSLLKDTGAGIRTYSSPATTPSSSPRTPRLPPFRTPWRACAG